MRKIKIVLLVSFFLFSFPAIMPEAPACDGTLVPVCARTIYLAKFAPQVVLIPPAGGPINVPVGLLPYVSWNASSNNCAQPSAATLTLTLNCTPPGGGAGFTVGPVNIPVPVPTVPGPQPLAGPGIITIPAGTVVPGQNYICTVVGSYSVTFSGGSQGQGTITGVGDTEVCLVEAAPENPDVPRLNMRYLPMDDEQFQTCRRGDQGLLCFLIENNDFNHPVTLNLNSKGRQTAGLPEGETRATAFQNGVFALSSPDPDTDTFAAKFTDSMGECEILTTGDPTAADPVELTKNITLEPGEVRIICIAVRSFGACLDGSCNERNLIATGTFDDESQSPALACASTIFLVGDVPAKIPLEEWQDEIKVGPFTDAIWSPSNFTREDGQLHHAVAIHPGNAPEGFVGNPRQGTLTRGVSFNQPDWPPSDSGSVRFGAPAELVEFNVFIYDQQRSFVPLELFCYVFNLDKMEQDHIAVPLIDFGEVAPTGTQLQVDIDAATNQVQVFDRGNMVGDWNLGGDPPEGFRVDWNTCRIFTRVPPAFTKTIWANPISFTHLLSNPGDVQTDTSVIISDPGSGSLNWTAESASPFINLTENAGPGNLIFDVNSSGLSLIPQTAIGKIKVLCPDAINSPLYIPVAARLLSNEGGSAVAEKTELPQEFALHQNYPNPFNPETYIQFDLPDAADVRLNIFDVRGQKVRELVKNKANAGSHTVLWNGRNDYGIRVSSGVYFYRLEVRSSNRKDFVLERKLLLMK
ncbi:MAG: T9SS C-terminal target domain-containing protein [Calditrichaeota bacterium]|nr:MAG: T9SS C-terminal target domain-containing protein [Calditrichota bacterium]